MSKKHVKKLGKTRRTTDEIIADAIEHQNSWMERRRAFAKRFFKKLNVFIVPKNSKKIKISDEKVLLNDSNVNADIVNKKKTIISAYWFPILCAIFVLFVILWVVFIGSASREKVVVIPSVPEPVEKTVSDSQEINVNAPSFDIVRIEKNGSIVIAGRCVPRSKISIIMNNKIIATQTTDTNGEFVYTSLHAFKPGNYTISLINTDASVRSENKVFVYISDRGGENSVSLLMTKTGSTILQSPKLMDGDLTVSKIDYLSGGRIVVTGNALPRLRVSLSLNDIHLGYSKVSDYKHYGLGADVDELIPGETYNLSVRLHDGDGNVIDEVKHSFVMPKMTGSEDTFYTVRRGDCLWIIARNFLKRGVLFSIIAKENNIKNPDLIFPKQKLKIPVGGNK